MCVEDCDSLSVLHYFGSAWRSGHNLGGWRCILNLSMFLLTISVGRFWSVQSVLEFNAIKKNWWIMSDIERVFWTVLFRMASRAFLFFTPSDSSPVRNWFVRREPRTPVVKLVWEAFQPLFSRWLRWFMKPRWELYLSFFSCSFFSAQSSFVSMALVYSKNTQNSFSLSKAITATFCNLGEPSTKHSLRSLCIWCCPVATTLSSELTALCLLFYPSFLLRWVWLACCGLTRFLFHRLQTGVALCLFSSTCTKPPNPSTVCVGLLVWRGTWVSAV